MSTDDDPGAGTAPSGQGTSGENADPPTKIDKMNMALALSRNAKLSDKVALLQTGAAQLRREVAEQTQRADAAEKETERLRTLAANVAEGHRYVIQQLKREHADEIDDVRDECRTAIARVKAEHADLVDQLRAQHATRIEQLAMQQLGFGVLIGHAVADPAAIPAGFPGRPTESVDAGEQVMAIGGLIAATVATVRADMDRRWTAPLTDREIQVMRAAASGMDSSDLKAVVGMSHKTVENDLSFVYGKLRVGNRGAALSVMFACGMLDVTEVGPTVFDGDEPVDGDRLLIRLRGLARCSDRDRLVAMLLARGDENPVIADKLNMKPVSVGNCVKNVLRALGARNRVQAVTILHYLAAVVTAKAAAPDPAGEPEREPDGEPAPQLSPTRGPGRWQARVRAATVSPDADPAVVKVFDTFNPAQQFIVKALAFGQITAKIASTLHVSPHRVDQHIALMCRRFKIVPSGDSRLAEIGRDLFPEMKEPS